MNLDEPITIGNLINGEFVDGELGQHTSRNPADRREVVGTVPNFSAAQVIAAIDAAAAAAPAWRRTSAPDRGRILVNAAEIIRSRQDELARLVSREMGKTLAEATGEVERTAEMAEYFGILGRLPFGDVLPDRRDDTRAWTQREPLGTVALITPWNDPFLIPIRKGAPALVTGNTVVMKPAPDTPVVGLVVAQILHEAGLPAGVFNTVTGDVEEISDALLDDPRIAGVSFTGSTATGQLLRTKLAARNVPLQTEMGGKNSAVLMPDADADATLDQLLPAIFGQTGQRCTAVSRLVVHESLLDRVEKRLTEAAAVLRPGVGIDEGTDMGPLVNERQRDRAVALVGDAVAAGATLAYGGGSLTDGDYQNGCFAQPTVLTGVNTNMDIWYEEVFGPVVAVVPFSTLEEAITLVNDTNYGLSAGVFTNDLRAAHRFVDEVDAGQVVVNLPPSGWDIQHPFGGFKDSGSAFKEHGLDGLQFYTRTKTVAVRS